MPGSVRQKLGAIGIDLPRFEWRLRRNWVLVRNRSEKLESAPDKTGMRCCWQWTSDLHLARVLPSAGRRLLQRALRDWRINFAQTPIMAAENPQVSFVIGHRGSSRLPHLLTTLRTIAAQRGVNCECIVVEQSDKEEVKLHLPSWVRYIHTKPPVPEMPYCRSWTLNVGARIARGALLVFHDNDMLVPMDYAAEMWRRYRDGYEVINLKRFVFYLDELETKQLFDTSTLAPGARSETIIQNLEAGGSVAVCRNAFLSVGGFDESFVGWGGEDNEFWERAQTRRVWPYGYLPIVHLWHPAQPRKWDAANPTLQHYQGLSRMPPEQRIAELSSRNFGRPEALSININP